MLHSVMLCDVNKMVLIKIHKGSTINSGKCDLHSYIQHCNISVICYNLILLYNSVIRSSTVIPLTTSIRSFDNFGLLTSQK